MQQFTDSIIATIEAKKLEIFDEVENQVQESLERLGMQKEELEQQVKMHESTIEKTETLLSRSTSAQIMQPKKKDEFLDEILEEEGDKEDIADLGNESFPALLFVRNQRLFDHVTTEQIGSRFVTTTTSPHRSSAEGKGISETTVGLAAQIVVTTRNTQGEQYYEEHDCVTVKIRNRQGHDCGTKTQVQDNKDQLLCQRNRNLRPTLGP